VKISERKRRLRQRGVVPVTQQEARIVKTAPATRKGATFTAGSAGSVRSRQTARTTAKGGADRVQARPRRQLGSGYQLTIGALYTVFAPLLLAFYIAQLRNPKLKTHPGALEILMTVLFFLFGVWNLYRGLQARRHRTMSGAAPGTPGAAGMFARLRRPRALKSSST